MHEDYEKERVDKRLASIPLILHEYELYKANRRADFWKCFSAICLAIATASVGFALFFLRKKIWISASTDSITNSGNAL